MNETFKCKCGTCKDGRLDILTKQANMEILLGDKVAGIVQIRQGDQFLCIVLDENQLWQLMSAANKAASELSERNKLTSN